MQPDRPVVANNTPLVALYELGLLSLLRDLFERVTIPEQVRAEFLAIEHEKRQSALDEAPWIETVSLEERERVRTFVGLDEGEAAVLALATERSARLVIIDERKGRRFAQRLDLTVTGTIGVLLLARERGLVPEIRPLLERLIDAGLYLSPALISAALKLAGEIE